MSLFVASEQVLQARAGSGQANARRRRLTGCQLEALEGHPIGVLELAGGPVSFAELGQQLHPIAGRSICRQHAQSRG